MKDVEAHKKRQREQVQLSRLRNPAHYRALQRKYSKKAKLDAFALFGSCCAVCGFTDIRALQMDHKTRPKGAFNAGKQRHGTVLYQALLKGRVDIYDFQLLCANCNQIKRAENNEIGVRHGQHSRLQASILTSLPQEEEKHVPSTQ